jgi:hypothetical protein
LNLLLQKELLDAKELNETMKQEMIANLASNGTDTLAARYINFGALQIELLDYRARLGSGAGSDLPYYHHSSSPSIVNNMHVCFYIRDDVDLNQFVFDFETTSKNLGFNQVKCNRIVHVDSEEQRELLGSKLIYNSFDVVDGPFKGLKYFKSKVTETIPRLGAGLLQRT